MAVKYAWKIRNSTANNGKIEEQNAEGSELTYGSNVEFEEFGAVFSGKTMANKIVLPANAMKFGTDPFTVSLWFNSTEVLANSTVFGNRSAGSHGDFVCIRYARKKIVAEFDNNGKFYAPLGCNKELNDGKWHHIAIVRSSTDHYLYVDGDLADSKSTKEPVDVNENKKDVYWLGCW